MVVRVYELKRFRKMTKVGWAENFRDGKIWDWDAGLGLGKGNQKSRWWSSGKYLNNILQLQNKNPRTREPSNPDPESQPRITLSRDPTPQPKPSVHPEDSGKLKTSRAQVGPSIVLFLWFVP